MRPRGRTQVGRHNNSRRFRPNPPNAPNPSTNPDGEARDLPSSVVCPKKLPSVGVGPVLPADGVSRNEGAQKRRLIPPSPPKSPQTEEAEVSYYVEEDHPLKRPKYPDQCDSAYRNEDENTDHEAEDPSLISDYSGEDGEEPDFGSGSGSSGSGSGSGGSGSGSGGSGSGSGGSGFGSGSSFGSGAGGSA